MTSPYNIAVMVRHRFRDTLQSTVRGLAQALLARSWRLATAESCTGGLVAAACTSAPGSSNWFEQGFVTYSDEAKVQMLGVSSELILQHGAVSEEVARAMALGARQHSQAQAALSVTGIAGPGGAAPGKPVGLVCFGWNVGERLWSDHAIFSGDRQRIREAAVLYALQHLLLALDDSSVKNTPSAPLGQDKTEKGSSA